jgi:hypothetical protein
MSAILESPDGSARCAGDRTPTADMRDTSGDHAGQVAVEIPSERM